MRKTLYSIHIFFEKINKNIQNFRSNPFRFTNTFIYIYIYKKKYR